MFSRESSGFYSAEFESPTHGSHQYGFAMAEESKFVYSSDSGDPYRELDDVTRGVSMAQPLGMDSYWLNNMHDGSSGSFFHKETSCTDTCINSFFSGSSYEYSPFEPEALFMKPSSNLNLQKNTFEAHHVPPSPPSSQHFCFVPSTLFIKDCSPQKLGNSVLDFLRSEVVASITKVRLEKYAIKAEVFVEGNSCMMKVRVYTQGDRYAVEVQRRQGDAFVLQSTYNLLLTYLGSCCGGIVVQESDKPLAFPAIQEAEKSKDVAENTLEVIAPVLTMATIAGLQAEAASALAEMAKGGRTSAAPLLECPDQVAAALTHLLTSDHMDTIYPAARCVSGLAAFGEAGPLLAHQGLLQAAANQAIAELAKSQGLVGTALAQAVVDAIQCCAGIPGLLSSASAIEIQELLDSALQNESLANCDSMARVHLEQALFNTRLCA